MKLKEEFIKMPKEFVYKMYDSLVYDTQEYDKITRSKMLDEIIKEYNQENYLYFICTKKELDFLKYAQNKKLNQKDIEKYKWEINELNRKSIFSTITYEVFEEQKDNVLKALEHNKKFPKSEDELAILMIIRVKTNAELLIKAFSSMITSLCNIDEKGFNAFLSHPLFHFYCGIYEKYIDSLDSYEEFVYYREYIPILEDLEVARLEYGIAGSIPCDLRDDFDTFYYGFPIRNEKVKKMYDEVNKQKFPEFLFDVIDEARVLNNRHSINLLIKDEMLDIVNEALDEMPCAAMNGFTPNQYNKEQEKEEQLSINFSKIPQNNAHLSKNAADEYYKLYFALLEYVNKKHNIEPKLMKIYKQEHLDPRQLLPIDKYLWEHKEELDNFINENPYNFNDEELNCVKEFKSAIKSEHFIVTGFQREYTEILAEDGKLYMVKGIRCDIDEIIDPNELPLVISTTLLMFKNKIIYTGLLTETTIRFGNDIKQAILNDYDKAIKYYHL